MPALETRGEGEGEWESDGKSAPLLTGMEGWNLPAAGLRGSSGAPFQRRPKR
jgi:hypothetical protein